MDKENVMQALSYKLDDNLNTFTGDMTTWCYWSDYYYPYVIKKSYPMYVQERAKDKGKQAFELIKILKDKNFIKLETVGDFIDMMDCLIKIL